MINNIVDLVPVRQMPADRARNSVAWCGREQELMTQLIYIDGNERRSVAVIGMASCATGMLPHEPVRSTSPVPRA